MSTIVRGAGQERVNRNLEELKTDARETEEARAARGATVVALRDGLDRRVSAQTSTTTTSSVSAPAVAWNAQKTTAAQSFASNASLALNHMKSMSADDLSSSFMKLNVINPDDSVEAQMNLINAQAELAKLAIKQARDAMSRANQKEENAHGRELFAKSIIATDPGGVWLQQKLAKWTGVKEFVAVHNQWALDQKSGAKKDSEQAKQETAAAQQQMAAAVEMLRTLSARTKKLLEQQVKDKDGNLTDWASIDGVPVPKVTGAINLAIGKIYKQLGDVTKFQGDAVMLNKVDGVARAELAREFKSAGLKNPETLIDFVTAQIVMDVTGAYNAGGTALGTGQALSDLGTAYDGASGTSGNSLELAAADIAALTEGDALEAQTLQRSNTRM